MNTWMVDAGTVMFRAYLEDERGENKQEAENVVSVELPKIELYKKTKRADQVPGKNTFQQRGGHAENGQGRRNTYARCGGGAGL